MKSNTIAIRPSNANPNLKKDLKALAKQQKPKVTLNKFCEEILVKHINEKG